MSPGLPFCLSAKRLGGQSSDSWRGTNAAAQRRHRRAENQSPALRTRHPATRPRTRPRTSHVPRPPRGSQCGGCRRLGPPLAPRARWGRSCTHSCSSQSLSSPRDPAEKLGWCRSASAGVSGAAMVGHLSEGAIAVRRRPESRADGPGSAGLERCKEDRGREPLSIGRASGRKLCSRGGCRPRVSKTITLRRRHPGIRRRAH